MSNFTVRVTDAQPASIDSAQNVTVALGLAGTLASANENQFYAQSLQAGGGVPPYTWSISSGALPPGLSIDPQSGVIYGEPGIGSPARLGSPDNFTFTVRVEDSSSPPQIATSVQALNVI